MSLGWQGWNRALSAVFYVVASVAIWRARGPNSALVFAISQPLVLLFIWFADFFSTWIGMPPMPGGLNSKVIDQESPAWLILAFGWLILLGTFALTYLY